jgi:monoamine oxidase
MGKQTDKTTFLIHLFLNPLLQVRPMKEKVIIIGSGFGGLGAAARLAAQGYQVEIFEKRDKPGGRP